MYSLFLIIIRPHTPGFQRTTTCLQRKKDARTRAVQRKNEQSVSEWEGIYMPNTAHQRQKESGAQEQEGPAEDNIGCASTLQQQEVAREGGKRLRQEYASMYCNRLINKRCNPATKKPKERKQILDKEVVESEDHTGAGRWQGAGGKADNNQRRI